MNATLDRMAVQAAVNPAALHILSRNLDVLGELRALDTTRAFGAQIEAYVALEGEHQARDATQEVGGGQGLRQRLVAEGPPQH